MSTSLPIRNRNELQELKNYYYETEQNLRNYALICLGINSALRISDLLDLRWRDVYSFERSSFLTHISIQEQNTDCFKPKCYPGTLLLYEQSWTGYCKQLHFPRKKQ